MAQPVVNGVYFLFLRHRLIYVGRSTDCYQRVAAHRANGREFDYASVMSCPEADTGWIEDALLDATRGNTQNRAQPTVAFKIRQAGWERRAAKEAEPPAPSILASDDEHVIPISKIDDRMRRYGLMKACRDAIDNGELLCVPTGGGLRRGVPQAALEAWLKAKVEQRAAAAAEAVKLRREQKASRLN